MQELDLRAYVLDSMDAKWQYPVGRQLFSVLLGGAYVCMTDIGINFWHKGQLLLTCEHDQQTRAAYDSLMQRRPASA